jgi:CheY-like chemotaxis protein
MLAISKIRSLRHQNWRTESKTPGYRRSFRAIIAVNGALRSRVGSKLNPPPPGTIQETSASVCFAPQVTGMLLTKGQKVLIVDDERWTSDTLATIFGIAGYEARPAYSAEEALEIINSWQPALVILDVVLPRMNGIDLAIDLAGRCPACQILLFSGNPTTAQMARAAAQAGHPFEILEKPVHPDLMLERASHLLSVH